MESHVLSSHSLVPSKISAIILAISFGDFLLLFAFLFGSSSAQPTIAVRRWGVTLVIFKDLSRDSVLLSRLAFADILP
jgi:hypothetical protein